ncbi:hypothetical protein ACGFOU_03215 [Streptomyces sp. NPDC048595]|uniref:hypothetical protein n=1 Tax=Streptomyces sp. NPDC048595 TaxID=3365576 RepID=UPI003720248D
MRKLQQVAIVVAAVGALSTFGAGVSFADGGPQVTAWAVSQSAAGATAQGGSPHGGYGGYGHQAAPQAVTPQAPAPQAAPQPAPQPQAPAPQAAPQPAPQAPAPQAAPQPAPQAVAPQAPAPQAQAPAPQPAPQPEPQASYPKDKDKDKGDKHIDLKQMTSCRSHDLNVDILGQVGLLNGALGNALNGEGDPGAQHTKQGSSMGCNNNALGK